MTRNLWVKCSVLEGIPESPTKLSEWKICLPFAFFHGEVSETTQAFTPVRAWVAKHRGDWPREITQPARGDLLFSSGTLDADISVTCQVNELLYLVDLLTYSLPAQKTLVVFKMSRREHSKALCQILVVLTLLDALASLQTSQKKRRTYDGWVRKKC